MLSFILVYCRLILIAIVYVMGDEHGHRCGWGEGYSAGMSICATDTTKKKEKTKKNDKKLYVYMLHGY